MREESEAAKKYKQAIVGEKGPCHKFNYDFETNPFFFRLLVPIVKFLTRVGWNVKVKGKERLPKNTNFVLMPNHVSHFDSFLIGPYFNPSFPPVAIGDEKLFKNNLFLSIAKMFNAFPVRKGTKSLAIVEYAISRIKNGDSMLWFPEGQRHKNPHENKCYPGKLGAGMLAHAVNVPIVPVFIHGAEFAMPVSGKLRIGKGPRSIRINVEIGYPVKLDDLRKLPPSKETSIACVNRIMDAIEELRPPGPYMVQNLPQYLKDYNIQKK